MAENLAYKTEGGDYYAYDKDIKNIEKYGYLYDIEVAQRACPSGWHLPTDNEWTILSNFLQGDNVAGALQYEDVVGIKLRTYEDWIATKKTKKMKPEEFNTSGFTALPSGAFFYYERGTNNKKGAEYKFKGEQCIWWALQDGGGEALYRRIYNYTSVFERYWAPYGAFSVRCLKNDITTTNTDGNSNSKEMTSDEALSALKRAKEKLDLGLITQVQYDSLKVVYAKIIQ